MIVIPLKEKIIADISATENEELLEQIADLIDLESTEIYKMSGDEINAVKEGIKKIENKQWVSHEDLKRQIDEWQKINLLTLAHAIIQFQPV